MNILVKVLERMKKSKVEYAVIFLLFLGIIAPQVIGCGATADTRFLKTNQEASQTFGNKLKYFYHTYQEQEGLTEKNVERRVKSIESWQESCKVAVEAHKPKETK